jgi:hypothetical protein
MKALSWRDKNCLCDWTIVVRGGRGATAKYEVHKATLAANGKSDYWVRYAAREPLESRFLNLP